MSVDHFATVAALLGRRVGLRMDPALRARLERVVAAGAARTEGGIGEYLRQLQSDPAHLQEVVDSLTVQVSAFFRDAAQFTALGLLIPGFPTATVIWSAGCAHGEEPYSIALAFREAGRRGRIVATDVSARAVTRARLGTYSDDEMRGVSAARRSTAFLRRPDSRWEVLADVKSMVTVERHSLITDPDPVPVASCSAVFCRNVLIYMARQDVLAVLARFARCLRPDGYLFLGSSESLLQVTDQFRLVQKGGAFIYQLAGAERQTLPQARAQPPVPVPTPLLKRDPPPLSGRDATYPSVDQLLAAGEAAITRRDHGSAIWALRKAVYLDPGHTIAHVQLGLALEIAGEARAAKNAFLAARSALAQRETAQVVVHLEGYGVDQLDRFLRTKLDVP